MKTRWTLMAAGLMALSISAMARPAFLQVFETTYKIKENSNLQKTSCRICHGGRHHQFNPYGQDLRKQLEASKTYMVTPAMLKSIEKLDSDKDGFSNIAEIKADTLPGDPASKPAGKPGKKK